MTRNNFIARLSIFLPSLLMVSFILFFFLNSLPGGPVDAMIARTMTSGAESSQTFAVISEAERLQWTKEYALDKPLLERYFIWLRNTLRGELGTSFRTQRPVGTEIANALPVTVLIAAISFFMTYIFAVGVGARIAFVPRHRRILSFLLDLAIALPAFATAVLLIALFASTWGLGWFPLGGLTSDNFPDLSPAARILDVALHLALPVVAFTVQQLAMYTFLAADSFRSEAARDYPLAAAAKGLSRRQVFLRHILPNGSLPLVASVAEWVPYCFLGNLLIEVIFNLRGLGALTYRSLLSRDYPVVLGIVLIATVFQISVRLFSDLLLSAVDPRVRFT